MSVYIYACMCARVTVCMSECRPNCVYVCMYVLASTCVNAFSMYRVILLCTCSCESINDYYYYFYSPKVNVILQTLRN